MALHTFFESQTADTHGTAFHFPVETGISYCVLTAQGSFGSATVNVHIDVGKDGRWSKVRTLSRDKPIDKIEIPEDTVVNVSIVGASQQNQTNLTVRMAYASLGSGGVGKGGFYLKPNPMQEGVNYFPAWGTTHETLQNRHSAMLNLDNKMNSLHKDFNEFAKDQMRLVVIRYGTDDEGSLANSNYEYLICIGTKPHGALTAGVWANPFSHMLEEFDIGNHVIEDLRNGTETIHKIEQNIDKLERVQERVLNLEHEADDLLASIIRKFAPASPVTGFITKNTASLTVNHAVMAAEFSSTDESINVEENAHKINLTSTGHIGFFDTEDELMKNTSKLVAGKSSAYVKHDDSYKHYKCKSVSADVFNERWELVAELTTQGKIQAKTAAQTTPQDITQIVANGKNSASIAEGILTLNSPEAKKADDSSLGNWDVLKAGNGVELSVSNDVLTVSSDISISAKLEKDATEHKITSIIAPTGSAVTDNTLTIKGLQYEDSTVTDIEAGEHITFDVVDGKLTIKGTGGGDVPTPDNTIEFDGKDPSFGDVKVTRGAVKFDDVFSIMDDSTVTPNRVIVGLRHEGALIGVFESQNDLFTAAQSHKATWAKGKVVGMVRSTVDSTEGGEDSGFKLYYWKGTQGNPTQTDIQQVVNWHIRTLTVEGQTIKRVHNVPNGSTFPVNKYTGQIFFNTTDKKFYSCDGVSWGEVKFGSSTLKISGQDSDKGEVSHVDANHIKFSSRDFSLTREDDGDYTLNQRGILITKSDDTPVGTGAHGLKFKGNVSVKETSVGSGVVEVEITGGSGGTGSINVSGHSTAGAVVTASNVKTMEFAKVSNFIKAEDIVGGGQKVTVTPATSVKSSLFGSSYPKDWTPVRGIEILGDKSMFNYEPDEDNGAELTLNIREPLAVGATGSGGEGAKSLTSKYPPNSNAHRFGVATEESAFYYCDGAKWSSWGYKGMNGDVASNKARFPEQLQKDTAPGHSYTDTHNKKNNLVFVSQADAIKDSPNGLGFKDDVMNYIRKDGIGDGLLQNIYGWDERDATKQPYWVQIFHNMGKDDGTYIRVKRNKTAASTEPDWGKWGRLGIAAVTSANYSVLVSDNDYSYKKLRDSQYQALPLLVWQDPTANIIPVDNPSGTDIKGGFKVARSGTYQIYVRTQYTWETRATYKKNSRGIIQLWETFPDPFHTHTHLKPKKLVTYTTNNNVTFEGDEKVHGFYADMEVTLEAGKPYFITSQLENNDESTEEGLQLDPFKNIVTIDPKTGESTAPRTAKLIGNTLYRSLSGLSFDVGYEVRAEESTPGSGKGKILGEQYDNQPELAQKER